MARTFREELGAAWAGFGLAVADPWNLLLLVSVIALLSISANLGGGSAAVSLQVVASVAAAVLGARVTNRYSGLLIESALEAKGKGAVRGLKQLYRSLESLDKRVREFLENDSHIREQPEVTTRNYEEILISCETMQGTTVGAIQNWTDIVAEANIADLYEAVAASKADAARLSEERDRLQEQLESAVARGAADTEELRNELHARDEKLSKLRNQLAAANSRLVSSGTSATSEIMNYVHELNQKRSKDLQLATQVRPSKLADLLSVSRYPQRPSLDSYDQGEDGDGKEG